MSDIRPSEARNLLWRDVNVHTYRKGHPLARHLGSVHRAHCTTGDYQEGTEAYRCAIALAPATPDLYKNLGVALTLRAMTTPCFCFLF